MNEETTNLTEDTIKFWNENAKPALSWIADRWMECYELSAGWTVGVTVVGGLYVLAKILPDSDDNPTAAAPTAAPTAAPKAARKASAPRSAKVTSPSPSPRREIKKRVEPKPQRTYEVKWIHRSNPKTVHTINTSIRANGLTEARMMVENSETNFGQFGSMQEIVSMRVWN
jgi:hypothetical protein